MTVRLCRPAHPGDKETIFHAHQKVAHRACSDVEIEAGNHDATGRGLEPIRAWHPIEVLHFSLRSVEQVMRKGEGGWLRNPDYEAPAHQLRLDGARARSDLERFYGEQVVGDDALQRGLAEGRLAVDTRLRDALRLLGSQDARFDVPRLGSKSLLSFPMPGAAESAMYAGEASTLVQIDGIVRAEERVDALERRIERLDRAWNGSAIAVRAARLIPGRRLARR